MTLNSPPLLVILRLSNVQVSHLLALFMHYRTTRMVPKDHNHIPCVPHVAMHPRISSHPQEIKDAVPGKPVVFTIQATGTEPLRYQWWWRPAETEGGSEEWQLCDVEKSDSASLMIANVQKSNEGSYCCVISYIAGTQTSEPVKLSIGMILYIAYLQFIITIVCSLFYMQPCLPESLGTHTR